MDKKICYEGECSHLLNFRDSGIRDKQEGAYKNCTHLKLIREWYYIVWVLEEWEKQFDRDSDFVQGWFW